MIQSTEVGRRGVYIAKVLWPALRLIEEGSPEDKNGTDGFLRAGNIEVQIKTDSRIALSQNLFLELWEKTKGAPRQYWRHSPSTAFVYIFVTDGFAVWVPVDTLATCAVGRRVSQIHETSIGILIPLSTIPPEAKTVKLHNLWHQRVLI